MERVFNQLYLVFQALLVSGQLLFDWLVSPFEDPIITSAFGSITPMELMFGLSLTLILTIWLSKFILK